MTHFTEANLTKRKVVRANIVRIANADTTPPIFFFLVILVEQLLRPGSALIPRTNLLAKDIKR
jgi:hypothetical protein